MTTGYDYTAYKKALATLAVVDRDNDDFVSLLPSIIDYAELRIYQDLDLLQTVATGVSSLIANNRELVLPLGDYVTIQNANVLTPLGTVDPTVAVRNPCLPVSKEYLDMVYGSAAGAGIPAFFAMLNQTTLLFGPWPDANYALELVGTIRPTSLSESNETTFLSLYLPSLFMMASMVYITMYQRNFSATSDDPQMGVNYEGQYKALLNSAGTEEARKKFSSSGWTSMSATPAATPTRG